MTEDSSGLDEAEEHRRRRGENRLPPVIAVLLAAVIYALLPGTLLFAPRLIIPTVEIALLVALLTTNTRRLTRSARVSRSVSVALSAVVIVTNLVALALLVHQVTSPRSDGEPLLVGAMQVWLTNVIGFALLYWELDRGGPVARRERRRGDLPPADWRFSQDENADTVTEVAASSSKASGWIPLFTDYAYLSLTNSSAFSPTDTMPLSTRAKALMGVQATAALLVSLLLVARAVGSLGS